MNNTAPAPRDDPNIHSTLALPSEIRHVIYQHLLSPDPHKSKLLYSDENPYTRSLNLHPAILFISRRTYKEAVPLLYGANTFEVSFNMLPSRGEDEPSRRYDGCRRPSNFLRLPSSKTIQSLHSAAVNNLSSPMGFISPSALHTLRHIELSFSYDSFWGFAWRPYLTLTAELILEILDLLGRGSRPTDPVIFTKQQRTLKLTIYSDAEGRWLNDSPSGLTTPGNGGCPRLSSSHVEDLVFLLENLRATTKVTVFEVLKKLSRRDKRECPATREVELEALLLPPKRRRR